MQRFILLSTCILSIFFKTFAIEEKPNKKNIYSEITISEEITDEKFFEKLQHTLQKEKKNKSTNYYISKIFELTLKQSTYLEEMSEKDIKNIFVEFDIFIDTLDNQLNLQKENSHMRNYIKNSQNIKEKILENLCIYTQLFKLGKYPNIKNDKLIEEIVDINNQKSILNDFLQYSIISDEMHEKYTSVLWKNQINLLLTYLKNSDKVALNDIYYKFYLVKDLRDLFIKILIDFIPNEKMIDENEDLSEKIFAEINHLIDRMIEYLD